jgi:osmotically-inducible protein OsmY/sporulation protein YlmC with PRC-barrel domain
MARSTVLKAREMVGDHVKNPAGENLGKIEDIVIDPATGSVLYAIVAFDGVFGAGDRLHAVPWSSLRPSLAGDYMIFEGDRQIIDRAPTFARNDWPDMTNPLWQDRLRDHYPRNSHQPTRERVVVQREIRKNRPASLFASALAIVLLLFLLGFSYLVFTRGWDRARDTAVDWVQGVAYAAKETSEDAALTAKVKTALSLSRRVPSATINVDTNNEVVTLRGEVPNEETRVLAEMIARDTLGVTELVNRITINPSGVAAAEIQRMQERVADLETKYLVNDALVKNPALAGANVQVEVQGQTATLNGTVQTADQKYKAEQIASSIDGVRSVNNQLRVNLIE